MASKHSEARARTTGVRTGGRVRMRDCILPIVSVVLACMLMAPSFASGLSVDKTTASSNEQGGNAVFGGVETRVTWEGTVGENEQVSSMSLVFPDGSDVSNATVTVTGLSGLDRVDLNATTAFDGNTLNITFATPVASGLLLRVEVHSVCLPTGVDTATVTGSYVDGEGITHTLDESPAIELENVTLTKRIVSWLDAQPWVASWNNVPILRTFLKPQLIVTSIPTLFFGWLRALGLVAVGFPLAIPLGLILAMLKMNRGKGHHIGTLPAFLSGILNFIRRFFGVVANIYINVVRGTPLFLQIYIAFFGLPLIGVTFNSYVLGFLVLAMNSSAYLAEIFRAGIQSINKGQFEAAHSLGMNGLQTMFFVIIPQTVRRVIPTMTSEFILLYKDSSLLSAVGVMELMMFSKSLTANSGNMTPYIVAALYYLIVTLPLIKVVTNFEAKLARADAGGSVDGKKKARKAKAKKNAEDSNDKPAWAPDAQEETILMSPAGHDSM